MSDQKQKPLKINIDVIRPGSRILISGCLMGISCNYKGMPSSEYLERAFFWKQICREFVCFPVCPEQLGGLATPRVPAELQGSAEDVLSGKSRVISRTGTDVNAEFIAGAHEAERLAGLLQVDCAVLKSRSPSCGKDFVYDGTFSGQLIEGSGLSARLFERMGLRVFSECEFMELLGVHPGIDN